MAEHTLLVLTTEQQKFGSKVRELELPDLDILVPRDEATIRDGLTRANILLANPIIAKKYINDARNVVWMQSTFAGIDALNDPTLRKDYVLTNARDVYGPAMAEYVFAYILLYRKEVLEHMRDQKEKAWKPHSQNTLQSQTLCILGAGSIGREIARMGKAFGMRVLGYRTSKKPAEHFDEIYSGDGLKTFLAEGDYIVDVLPNTAGTTNLIESKTIAAMKQTAVFINVGRGNSVNEDDIFDAVKKGRIAKAVLDVFKKEPLPAESPLWVTENVFITPHISGSIVSDEIFSIFAENYRRFRAGRELKYQVDFQKGY